MDVDNVSRSTPLDGALSALTEAAEALETLATGLDASAIAGAPVAGSHAQAGALGGMGFAERILGEPSGGAAPVSAPASEPGAHVDHGQQSATVQTFARAHPPAADAPRPIDPALSANMRAASEFAIPGDQLVPVALASLQVDPGGVWAMSRRFFDAPLPEPAHKTPAPPPPPLDDDAEAHARAEDEADAVPDDGGAADVLDEAAQADWCAALTRSLQAALAQKVAPHALLAAAEQWQRGRCVVVACPQGADPAGPAWAFVLWPRKRLFAPRRLALTGQRVDARLQWSSLPPSTAWCHVRVIKEHHPRRGRQLITLDNGGAAAVACEVQLGPVLARSLRWAVVCLRIDAVRRFWAALGAQWSATVVVSARPLLATADRPEAPC